MRVAAFLLWEDRQTDEQIAATLGICRRTLSRWKHRPAFRKAWAKLQEAAEWRYRLAVLGEVFLAERSATSRREHQGVNDYVDYAPLGGRPVRTRSETFGNKGGGPVERTLESKKGQLP